MRALSSLPVPLLVAPAPPELDAWSGSHRLRLFIQVGWVIEDALELSLGCGDPTALAGLKPGETVLDLGSGGGIDALLSSRRVDPNQRQIRRHEDPLPVTDIRREGGRDRTCVSIPQAHQVHNPL